MGHEAIDYRDVLYGTVHLVEPVLCALVRSTALQRLKGIHQHGVTAIIGLTPPFTRYAHSVGTMLLVRRLGGGLDEQIGALLHDVSHTAFSHVIDYVVHDHHEQGYHERNKLDYVATTDIPAILAAHRRDWHAYMREEAFPLLEQPAPALCADRLDYFLRDIVPMGLGTAQDVSAVLEALRVCEGRIVIEGQVLACWLAQTYMAADRESWANPREVGLYELAAQAIRAALELGWISEAQLWGEDMALWHCLQACVHPAVRTPLAQVSSTTQFIEDPQAPDLCVSSKRRTLDPAVWQDGMARPLSELDAAFARMRQAYCGAGFGRWTLRVQAPS